MTKKQPAPYKLGGSPQDREVIRLRDRVSYLEKELKTLHRQGLDDDTAKRILGNIGSKEPKTPQWLIRHGAKSNLPEVPVIIWSDWHVGETVSFSETNGFNEFNTAVLKKRVERLVERTIRLADRHGGNYPGIVLNLLGDFVSGGLHPELQKTDEIEIISSVLLVRDLLIWGIKKIADRFGQVYIPCAAGNHGRSTPKPEFKRYAYKNFDWMIYQLLQKEFTNDRRLHFDVRPSNEVLYRVFNKRILAMHGDMLGVRGGDGIIGALGPITRGEIKVRGSTSSLGMDYDLLVIGHWHQPLWLPRVIVANSLKGWDEYARLSLRAPPTVPSQPMFFVHPTHGITSRWEIHVSVPDKNTNENNWVSVLDRAA